MKTTAPSNLKAATIEEAIAFLTEIVEWSKHNKSRCGYFAALYRKVTIRVKEGIENGEFEDGPRMEKLDVIFANRYLQAFDYYHGGRETTHSWRLAFDNSARWRPIVLQHLLLGMNAHIDLDLGIAAAEAAGESSLDDLKNDFNQINSILASLVDNVQNELAQVWPLLKILDRMAGKFDESLANLGMKFTRGRAWQVATALHPLASEQRAEKILALDGDVVKRGELMLGPGLWPQLVLLFIRLGELRSVKKIIQILE